MIDNFYFIFQEAIDLCVEAIEKAGYTGKIKIGMDVAASEFCKEGNKYDLESAFLKSKSYLLPSLQNLEAATSIPTLILPVYPAFSMASAQRSVASWKNYDLCRKSLKIFN